MFSSFLDKHALRWLLLAPVIFAFGAATYLTIEFEPPIWVPLGALATFASIYVITLPSKWYPLSLLSLLLLAFWAGLAVAQLKSKVVSAPRIHAQSGIVRVEGQLKSIDRGSSSQRLTLLVSAISNLSKEDTPRFVRLSHKAEVKFVPGRHLSCLAIISPPPGPQLVGEYDFRRQAYFQQLGGVGFTLGACEPTSKSNFERAAFEKISLWLNAIRRDVAVYVAEASGEQAGGMAAAMITGDRSMLSTKQIENLRNTGLAHLLAISGLHMGLAAGVFFFVSRMLWLSIEFLALRIDAKKAAAASAILGSSIYLLLSGASVATQRAYVMSLIALTAILINRPAFTLRSLGIAMFIVTLFSPEAVVTPGYQMSFAATAVLITMYENWSRSTSSAKMYQRGWSWVISVVMTSIAASIATAPFGAYHFGRVAILSIPANLVVMPAISIWAAPSAAMALIAAPFGGADPFLVSLGSALNYAQMVAGWFAEMSPVSHNQIGTGALFSTIAVICMLVFFDRHFKALAFIPMAALLFFWLNRPAAILHVTTEHVVYINTKLGWISAPLHDGVKNRPLKPLSIDAEVTKKSVLPIGVNVNSKTGEDIRFERLDSCSHEIYCLNLIIKHQDTSHLEYQLSPETIEGGLTVSRKGRTFQTYTLQQQPFGKRPWY